MILYALPASSAIVADHSAVAAFEQIPAEYFSNIRDTYKFFYGHTSHGSQIMTGLGMLAGEDETLYAEPQFYEYGDDLGHNGDTSWVQPTRDFLNSHPDYNAVLWSWCGGCSDNTVEGISTYLAAMEQLESEYPGVLFVYMTGHLDGSGLDGVLYRSNNQIREYCAANNKVLFDFADIESWDPAGNYYPDEDDDCYWCYDWCAEYDCPTCGSCAHSHCFNCYLKGKGFWWMMATYHGYQSTDVDDGVPTRAFNLVQNRPNPFNPATEILFSVAKSGSGSLAVFDFTGKLVSVLHEGSFTTGRQSYIWSGRDAMGRIQPAGTYFCRLRIGDQTQSLKMTLLK